MQSQADKLLDVEASIEDDASSSASKEHTLLHRHKELAAILFYAFTSIAITFFNKAVFAVYSFNFSNVLTLGQMLFALAGVNFLKNYGYVTFPDFDRATLKACLPLGLSYVLMVVSGLWAMVFLNIPMFSALRRFTTLVVLILETRMLGKKESRDVWAAIIVMVAGAALAGLTDPMFSFPGYFWVGVNCFVTAAYLIYVVRIKRATGLETFGLIFYNNLIALPLQFLICIFSGEASGAMEYAGFGNFGFLFCFFMSSVLALLLNYSIFLCTTVCSPLTTSITGQVKNVVTSIVGLFAFGDVKFVFQNIAGLFISLVASLWYAWLKSR